MTIFEELAERSIRLRRIEAGHREQVLCPRCEGGRRREQSLTVTIDRDGMGAVWLCHRGSCGWNGSVRPAPQPNQDRPKAAPQPPRKPRAVKPEDQQRPDWLYDFFAERNIGARTVDWLGIYAAERRFPPPVGTADAIVFPYVYQGEVVNRKYRPHPAKNPMMQEPGSLPTLYNADSISADHPLIWVEGECDIAALVECGFEHVVTLKDGAPVEATFRENDARFTALATHADELKVIRSHVLAGDADKPGHALREELARRLGRQKVLLVKWPDDCKDACDVLRLHGPEAVRVCIETAQPYPIDGLVRIKATTLIDLRSQPSPATMTTGVESIDAILKLPAEGRLIIITGYPSHGKTTWVRFVMVNTAKDHNRKWLVFSPEHQPWQQFVAETAEALVGKPFYPMAGVESMSDDEIVKASGWLSDRVAMLVCDTEDKPPTLDWILERAEMAILRDGITDLHIDPWNELEHNRGDLSDTDYTGRCLQRCRGFGQRHGVNVWLTAHPAKPMPSKPGENRKIPDGYDISGSAHWNNKTDVGITVWAPRPGEAEIHLWKARFRRWGVRTAIGKADFDQTCGRYRQPIREIGGILA